MPWITALKSTARSGFTLERTITEPLAALRGALGVAIVVFTALALGSPALATSAALGAFIAGTATFQRSFRPRPVLALGAAAGLSASTFVGYLASPWPAVFVAVVGVWAFAAGLAWALGTTAGIVASTTVSVMLVVVTLPVSVAQAAQHAGVIAAGGIVQAVLAAVWPVRPWGAQRDALADAYASMADYARRLRHDPFAAFDPEALMAARSAAELTPHQARRRPAELGGMRRPMERIRPVLAALADPRVGAAEEGPERDRAREILGGAAEILDVVARSIRTGRPATVPERAHRALAVPASGPVLTGAGRQAALRLIGLLAETADTLESPGGDTGGGDGIHVPGHLPRPSVPELLPITVHAVRRQWDWSSPVLRHAVRLGSVAAIGDAIGFLLPFGHGYWAPLTAAMVMRPDFSQTYSRGVARIVGTFLGVAVASGVLGLTGREVWLCASLAVLCVGANYLVMRTGYAAMSFFISGYVVFLLATVGAGLARTAAERLGMTLLGGTLALVAYAVFPTWQTTRLPDRLAAYIEAGGSYAAAAVGAFTAPSPASHRAVREALLDHRKARADLLTATQQAAVEPVRHQGLRPSQIAGARAAMAALGRTSMLMEAHLPAPGAPPAPGAERFAALLREETGRAAEAIRLSQPVDLSAVRTGYEHWAAQLTGDAAAARTSAPLVLQDAGYLVEALEGLQDALAE